MSDIGEVFAAKREAGREKRAANRDSSAQVLVDHGVSFESKNDGAHLIVRHAGKVADLWPGTGKWVIRPTNNYRRGVFSLPRTLGVLRKEKGA